MNDPEHTKAYKPEKPAARDETVGDTASQPECPSTETLLELATGELGEANANSIRTHLNSCADCTTRINQLRGRIDSFFEAFESTQSPHGDKTAVASSPGETTKRSNATAPFVEKESESLTSNFGDYELISEVARGGMGVVYKARQKSLNRIVALKMIKSGEFANQEQVDRFHKEAEAAANLDHPGIVPVHEVGDLDGQHYFTMGFVDGESLADRLREGPLPPKEAARYVKSISEAVAYAHSKGVIHRDLKPGNVLITHDEQLRITDFGLAKRVEEDSELTSTGQVLGTPSYMPPEQAEGKLSEIGPAADIYSIGATLYCILVGRPPFQAANLIETLQQVMHTEPVSLKVQNPAVPTDLETLCLKCLEKKPKSRYESTTEVVDELNRFLNGEPIVARPIGRVERMARWCKRKPAQATALIALGLIPIIITGAFIRQSILARQAAVARVDTLLNATPATIPVILEELDRTAVTVGARLRSLDSQERLERSERIRVSLALLPYDSNQLNKLTQRFSDCTYDELEVLLDRIRCHGGDSIVEELWTGFRGNKLTENQRFRTGIALAALDPDSEQWVDDDFQFLVTSMLAVNTVYQPAVRRSLAPMAGKLADAARQAYESAEPGTLADESSANAIVDFAANDTELLSELSVLSSPKQHSVVFPVVKRLSASDEAVVGRFVETTKLQPGPDDNELARIKLGKRRAGAAINLVRLNKSDEALDALRVKDDPESLTQFVHGCKARGVTVEQLLDLLNRATSVSERYGLLLALGEFGLADINEDIRAIWVDYIKGLYANDPSSGIHGASGWLLRKWGLAKDAQAIEECEVPYSRDREWFTLKINLAGPLEFENYGYFTFVVFPAGEYEIGSPSYEAEHDSSDEQRRVVTITRPFAVLEREVSVGEMSLIVGNKEFVNFPSWSRDPLGASVGMSWYLDVKFCRGLSSAMGLPESSQAYLDPDSLDKESYPFDPETDKLWDRVGPKNWPLDLSKKGFRLPTSAEWEIACRGGTVTRYGFGCDTTHLGQYCWYLDSSENRAHRSRELRPNLRGLFDMHGNMFEWCHDWEGMNPTEDLMDPLGPQDGSTRVLRGGSWNLNASYTRSARRDYNRPSYATSFNGFRVVFSLTPLPISK